MSTKKTNKTKIKKLSEPIQLCVTVCNLFIALLLLYVNTLHGVITIKARN